jgi:hypothetical protein
MSAPIKATSARCLAAAWLLALALPAIARQELPPGASQGPFNASGTLVLDGTFVHNVGELQMNITNFGVFGSYPSVNFAMSESPSAQWPAGSGVEYIWGAGLYCGARVSGIPRVSTSDFLLWEFRPGIEPIYTLYRSFEGTRNGNRLPSPAADDDNDGKIDEDPLNGFDDDGDGAIDEDYAAISNQMFHCTYRDDLPESYSNSADHQPLNLFVVQESYQWENDRVDDFVGLEFTVYNIGEATLEDFYLGFFADPDVGARSRPNNFDDDLVDVVDATACVTKGAFEIPVKYAMGVAWDEDGDLDGDSPALGQIGIMFMGHTIDPAGVKAPPRVTLRSWQAFSGSASFEDGGDPTNDEQRYALMSAETSDKKPNVPRDYRMLLSAGPFLVESGDSLKFQVAFVVGLGREGLLENAAQAKLTYDGNWFNLDGDITTPNAYCAETLLYDPFNDIEWASPCDTLSPPILVPKGTRVWVNDDCLFENEANALCQPGAVYGTDAWWCTGVDGLESQIHWLYGSPPPPPNLRIWPTEGKNVLFWDNFSETIPDVSELIYDFEGYRVWRADNWDRPFGSSIDNGPSSNLWMLLAEYDLQNELGADTGLEGLRYQPNIDASLLTFYADALMDNPNLQSARELLPPVGYTLAEGDTAIAMAKTQLGLPGGKVYYRYEDERVHTGMHYFYSVTAMDHIRVFQDGVLIGYAAGLAGDPSSGFVYTVPQSESQPSWDYNEDEVYVVPNPATSASMAPWALEPNNDDPTGLKVEFRHLPAARCTIRVYTLAGDLVKEIVHDQTAAIATGDYASTGSAAWDLVSRNGQDVASGVYVFSVEADGFDRKVGKFIVIR